MNSKYVKDICECDSVNKLDFVHDMAQTTKDRLDHLVLENEDMATQTWVASEIESKADITYVDSKITTHADRVDNPHVVTKTHVGLGNVDNTSDADKPISTATQTALDGKADKTYVDGNFVGKDTNGNVHVTGVLSTAGSGAMFQSADGSKKVSFYSMSGQPQIDFQNTEINVTAEIEQPMGHLRVSGADYEHFGNVMWGIATEGDYEHYVRIGVDNRNMVGTTIVSRMACIARKNGERFLLGHTPTVTNGDVLITRQWYLNQQSSDERLKENIEELTDETLDKLQAMFKELPLKKYDKIRDYPNGIGYIAQDVERLCEKHNVPRDWFIYDLRLDDDENSPMYKHVRYDNINNVMNKLLIRSL